jgi:hypothetical protein
MKCKHAIILPVKKHQVQLYKVDIQRFISIKNSKLFIN